MKTDLQRFDIIAQAEIEILEILKRDGLTLTAENMVVFINHIENHDNGDLSVRGRSIS